MNLLLYDKTYFICKKMKYEYACVCIIKVHKEITSIKM
jgi:hypothetical protein